MEAEFLGTGWKFPVGVDSENRIQMAPDEESIRQAIWMILGTAKGERVMRPDFGCGINDMVFAVNDAATAGRVAGEVREALVRWESRIDLLDVKAVPSDSPDNQLVIEIEYRVRSTNSRFNLVYPFYLE